MNEEFKIQPEVIEPNLMEIPLEGSNIVPSGGGSILANGSLKSDNFNIGSSGWQLDSNGNLEANDGNFRGDITGASGTFSGTLTGGSLNIPDTTTANSFHVESDGDSWWGTNVATGHATAPAKILKDGAATFSSVTITGGSVATAVLDKGVMAWETNLVFSATDADTVAWTSGTLKMQDTTDYSIDAGNTGNMSALTYIYLDIAVSLTVLQTTTTYSTAVGNGKILVCTALNQASGYASYIPRGGQAPAIATSQINSGVFPASALTLSSRGWSQTSVFSSTDLDTVSWGSGTFTSADGTAYSIDAGNTGNMSAKTYIYLDTAVSTTAYQITTTATTALGNNKVLVAVAQNTATEASFEVLQGAGGKNIDAAQIVAGTITGNEIAATTIAAANIVAGTITTTQIASSTIMAGNIAASTITSDKMSVSQLSAIAADLGTITAGSINVNSGQAIISSNGDATFKSIQIGGSTRQYTLNNSGIFSFGDGSDGDHTTSGDETLTADMYYQNLTIANGHTVYPAGYRIFVQDTLTLAGTGKISGDGGNGGGGGYGVANTGGNGGAAGTAIADGYLKGSIIGATGGRGSDRGGTATVGGNGTGTTNSIGLNGSNGGYGGSGTGSGGASYGTAGTATASNVKLTVGIQLAQLLDVSSTGSTVKYNNSASGSGGGGGGYGGGTTGGAGGGGGGSATSGRIVAIYAKKIVIGASASITANGGTGGKGGNGADGDQHGGGGAGGGAGGNGGIIILVYNTLTNSGTGNITVTAGTGGAKGTAGTGPLGNGDDGNAGSDGSAGTIYYFNLAF